MGTTAEAFCRGRDVVVGLMGGLISMPAIVCTAVVVRVRMGAPALFCQQRPGRYSLPFTLVKFRTMRLPDPGRGLDSDAVRMTGLGRVLRSTSLDELPTLWNVLRGDMSLVGPRPLLTEYLGRYTAEQARRHEVRPGITGWAQVNGRNSLDWDERLAMDVWYVDNRSLRLDALILWRTIAGVLSRTGISADGHATMPAFQGSRVDGAATCSGVDRAGRDTDDGDMRGYVS